jgi:hypothetical protein
MICIKYLSLILIIIICGCSNNSTIPAARKDVNKKAVASYIVPMGDPKLDWKFGAEVFETPETFKYFLVMYQEGTIQNDTLVLPDLGIWPVVQIKPGTEKLSCIIGFLDDKNVFREYKMLSVKDNQLILKTLKRYYTGSPQQ